MVYVTQFIFYGIPIGALIFFIISLCRYQSAKHRRRHDPASISDVVMQRRKILLLISSLLAGVLLAVVIAFIALMFLAVAFM